MGLPLEVLPLLHILTVLLAGAIGFYAGFMQEAAQGGTDATANEYSNRRWDSRH